MQIKFDKILMLLKNSKMKTYIKPQNCSYLLPKKYKKEIWQEQMNAQDRNKDLKRQKVQGEVQGSSRFQLSNVIKIFTESLTFLGMTD